MPVRSASPTKMSPYGASAKSKKRKLMRNELSLAPLGLPVAVPLDGSNILYDTPASTSPIKRRLDIAELETKKMLLPYLEKIEYVNEQLRARGIGIAMPFTTQGSAISPTKNQEADDLVVESLSSRSEKEEPTPPQHIPVVSNVACTSITFETLHQRYHRFCSTITTKKPFRRRPLGWLLRFMEEVYDDYYQKYITTQRVASFPLFVRSYLDHCLGLVSLADQDALDLLFNVELNRDNFPSIALFAAFLREIEDEEGVLFYAHCRAVIQATFGLSLKSNEKLLADAASRKFHSPGAIVLANHPLINDGTQSVHLSKEAVGLAFSCAANLTGPRKHLADYVARYSMNYQQAVTVDSRGGPEMTQELVSMDEVLARFLQLLRAVPEDIVLKYKYDDDGESFTLLTRLSDTIQRDVEINSSKVALAERVRSLRSLEIECMKLERSPDNSRPDIRTQIFLLKGQIASEARAVSSLQDQLNHTEGHVNAVWSSVLSDAAKAPKVRLSPLDNILARVVDYVATLHHDTQLEKKIKKALDLAAKKRGTSSIKTWSTQLDALQERCAIKIQRYFRQRRAWRRQRDVAKADLISRRQQHQKRKAEKELERKRLEALRERDAERHRNRMKEKNRRDEDLQNKIKAKEQAVLKKAALAESERRCAKANKELVRRVWSRWQRYVVVCRRTKLGKRMALMYRFRQWRECISETNAVNGAATMIQAGFRGMLGRRVARQLRRQRDKKSQLAHRNVTRLLHRRLYKVWRAWSLYVDLQLEIKRRFAAKLTRCLADTFTQWARLLPRRRSASLKVQTQWRRYCAAKRVQHLRREGAAATTIQRVFRGRQGRQLTQMKRQLKAQQTQGTNSLLRRMLLRTLSHCFDVFKARWVLEKRIQKLAHDRIVRRREWCFKQLARYRISRQRKQAERFRRQFEAAIVIQRYFRGYWCRVAFRRMILRHRSACTIQDTYRRYRHKWIVYEMQRQTSAAIRIQCLWRRKKAVAVVARRRNEFLWQAARRGDYNVVLRSFNNGTAWTPDEDGNSVLHLACLAGSKRVIKLCLRYGMDINGVNARGLSPLHTIISTTYLHRAELANYMIDHGAWHEMRDGTGLTPLLTAASLGHVDCVNLLLARAADRTATNLSGQTALAIATSLNHVDVAAALLNYGCDPNTLVDYADGVTLLHECAAHGYIELAKLLVDYKANLDAQDSDGNTPLVYAAYDNHLDVLALLLARGAQPDVVNRATRSAMHWAALGKPEAVRLLAEYNGDVNLQTREGETPLHLSCASDEWIESSKALLSYGGSVDSRNIRGNQPAHVAARAGAAATMDLLIQYSTNMNYRNFDNKNPLGEARMFNQKAVVAVIQRHFADDMKTLEEADDEFRDEDGVVLPNKSPDEWVSTLARGVRLSKLNEWVQCVDPDADCIFYFDESTNTCSWQAPIEFRAALGDHWRIQQKNPLTGSQRDLATTEREQNKDTTTSSDNTDNSQTLPKVYVYVHDQTGETRTSVPPTDPSRVQELIQGVDQYKMLRSRVHKVSSETAASVAKYNAFWNEFTKDATQLRAETHAAIKIQKQYRAHLYHQRFLELKLQHKTAVHLQRVYRGRIARRAAAHERRRHRCATAIQALIRGFLARRHEANGLHAMRVQHRTERLAALDIQRCWRGMHGRFRAKKRQAMKTGPQNYYEWADARKHATIVSTFSVWQEMKLANTSGYGIFYCNPITGQCVWDKPAAWIEYDRAKFLERQQMHYYGYTTQMYNAAVYLQSLYRMRKARVYFHRLMQGVTICRHCEQEYLRDPLNLTRLGNYTLYLHAVRHDYDRARPLYQRLMEFMAHRGPDIPFILRCYAIFLYVTEEEDIHAIQMLLDRADAIDIPKKKFQLAFLGFFRYAQIMQPNDAQSNLNYAACQQWIYYQYPSAKEHYLRALEADPYNTRILSLFQVFLERTNDPEPDGAQHFIQYQAATAQSEDTMQKQAVLAAKSFEERQRAVCLIQARFRARKDKKRVMCLKSLTTIPTMMLSPEERQLQMAFESVASQNRNPSILRLEQIAQVYPLVGWSAQDAADDIAHASRHDEFQYPESITWTRFHKWIKEASPPTHWETCAADDGAYFYNVVTGVSQWEKPRVARSVAAPLANQWEVAYTDQGEAYYYNLFTGESRWDDPNQQQPSSLDEWEEAHDDEGRLYYYNVTTGESRWTRPNVKGVVVPVMDQWEEATTDDGTTYFVNTISGESIWSRPTDGWLAGQDDEGRVYYYHTERNECQWSSPWATQESSKEL